MTKDEDSEATEEGHVLCKSPMTNREITNDQSIQLIENNPILPDNQNLALDFLANQNRDITWPADIPKDQHPIDDKDVIGVPIPTNQDTNASGIAKPNIDCAVTTTQHEQGIDLAVLANQLIDPVLPLLDRPLIVSPPSGAPITNQTLPNPTNNLEQAMVPANHVDTSCENEVNQYTKAMMDALDLIVLASTKPGQPIESSVTNNALTINESKHEAMGVDKPGITSPPPITNPSDLPQPSEITATLTNQSTLVDKALVTMATEAESTLAATGKSAEDWTQASDNSRANHAPEVPLANGHSPLMDVKVHRRRPSQCSVRNKCTNMEEFLNLMGMKYKNEEIHEVAAVSLNRRKRGKVAEREEVKRRLRSSANERFTTFSYDSRRNSLTSNREEVSTDDASSHKESQSILFKESPMATYDVTMLSSLRPPLVSLREPPPNTTFPEAHNETCGVCGLEGSLLCCDSCEKAFHLCCIQPPLFSAPPTAWSCAACEEAKYPWRFDMKNFYRNFEEFDRNRDAEIRSMRQKADEIKQANQALINDARHLSQLIVALSTVTKTRSAPSEYFAMDDPKQKRSSRSVYLALEASARILCKEVLEAKLAKKKKN